MRSILITGTSSGYGLSTAHHFTAQGWRAVATMRTPRREMFPDSPKLKLLPLDLTKPAIIHAALEAAGDLDAIFNYDGIGVVGAFEATPMATVGEPTTSARWRCGRRPSCACGHAAPGCW